MANPVLKQALRGFTLLEILIAMSLLGIMLILLFGSFAICSRSWNAGEDHIHKVEQMAMVQNFFRKHLSAAGNLASTPQRASGSEDDDENGAEDQDAPDEQAFFRGEEQYLQFVSLLPESAARGGWYLFKVGFKRNTKSLYVAMTPFLPFDARQPPEAEELEILPQVESLALAYWGKKDEGELPQWHKEWVDMQVLPELISINIKLPEQSAWPTLVVAPRLAPMLVNSGG